MQRLEAKTVNRHTYYYFSLWGWKNGKCRRLSQKYLGKAEDIAQAVAGTGPTPQYAQVLDWALPLALWQEARQAQVAELVDQLCPKRDQGLILIRFQVDTNNPGPGRDAANPIGISGQVT